MKKIIILLFMMLPLSAQASQIDCSKLTEKQIEVLVQSHQLGEPFDLSYSLAAIAWQESHAGEWRINMQDPSFGVYHLNINTIMHHAKAIGVKDTKFRRNIMAQKVMDDIPYSASIAIEELRFWYISTKKDWIKTWASYNGGTRGVKIKAAKEYAYKIKEAIHDLRTCDRFQSSLYKSNKIIFEKRLNEDLVKTNISKKGSS